MVAITAALSVPGVAVAATEAATHGFDLSQIITAGVTPALVLLLILTGKLYPSGIVDTYKARADQAEQQRDAANRSVELLNGQMLDRVVPALTLATQVLDRLAPMLATESTPHDQQHAPPPRPAPRYQGR